MLEGDSKLTVKRRRVLSLDPAGLLWGSERALLDFIGRIPGYEAACCCPPNSLLQGKLGAAGVRCFPYFKSNLHQRGYVSRFLALLGLLRAILQFKPDVLHVNQAGASRIALMAGWLLRIPCVVHVRLREDVEYLSRLKFAPDFLRSIIAVSKPMFDLIADHAELGKLRCYLALDAYRMSPHTGGLQASDTLKWDFICVGRFCEAKGQEILIRAIHAMSSFGDLRTLAFVGELNEYSEGMQRLVRSLGIEDQVAFLGHSDTVGDLLVRANWLICPSDYETVGRVLFEAWDYGIPVVACAQSGGAAAIVKCSNGGCLFDHWTAESLAARLSEVVRYDCGSREKLAANGRTWLLEQADPQRYASTIEGILNEVVDMEKVVA